MISYLGNKNKFVGSSMGKALQPECPVHRISMREGLPEWWFTCPECELEGSTLVPRIDGTGTKTEFDEGQREVSLSAIRNSNGTKLLQVILDEAPGRKLLDVGSGPGFFLSLATAAGFDASGVEPDMDVAEKCMRSGMRIYSGFFPEVVPQQAVFDAITLNDVLEHIPDLPNTFLGFRFHLRSGGLLVLNCPDRRGVLYRIAKTLARIGISGPFERMWQKDLPSPHVWYFTGHDLRVLAEQNGFDFVRFVELRSLSRAGLYERITLVKKQRSVFNLLIFAFVWAVVPLQLYLPRDISAVVMRRR